MSSLSKASLHAVSTSVLFVANPRWCCGPSHSFPLPHICFLLHISPQLNERCSSTSVFVLFGQPQELHVVRWNGGFVARGKSPNRRLSPQISDNNEIRRGLGWRVPTRAVHASTHQRKQHTREISSALPTASTGTNTSNHNYNHNYSHKHDHDYTRKQRLK
jgi:hypothetical protein